MKTLSELKRGILADYESRRSRAERAAELYVRTVREQHPELAVLEQAVAEAGADLILAAREGAPGTAAMARLRDAENRRQTYLAAQGIPLHYDEPEWTCPICRDTGRVPGGFCACFQQRLMPVLRAYLHLDQLDGMTFEQFNPMLFSDEATGDGPTQRAYMTALRTHMAAYVDEFVPGKSPNMLFAGPPGTGKTFLAGCIANRLDARGVQTLYMPATDLFQNLQQYRRLQGAYAPDREALAAAENLYDLLLHVPLLILDDLGAENAEASTRLSEWLQLINYRVRAATATIVSTNLAAADLAAMYDERLLSRLYGHFQGIAFDGADLRLKWGGR